MIWLVLGVILWSAVHFVPTLAQPLRQSLVDRLGDGRYRLGFSLVVVTSIVMMVLGWRSTPPVAVYELGEWARPISTVLMWAALFLFAAARSSSRIKRLVQHPQLMSIAVWGLSHLISNGTTRSLVLFGGLAVWALVEMPLLNARDGARVPGPTSSWAGRAQDRFDRDRIVCRTFLAAPLHRRCLADPKVTCCLTTALPLPIETRRIFDLIDQVPMRSAAESLIEQVEEQPHLR